MVGDEVRIDRRFRGPPGSGNGGYVAGCVAAALGGSGCVVTLRQPPPLDTVMRLERGDSGVALLAGDELVASATPTEIEVEVPTPPNMDTAVAAETRFTGFRHHHFPGCFVCGPEREAGDGLRIFPGAIDNVGSQVATVWRPDESLGDEAGLVRPEFIWAALDCPGFFAVEARSGPAVLGRMGVVQHGRVRVGEPVIVTGWPIASDGRKHHAGTALHDADGRLIAASVATWISLQRES
ncbi:hypothetical protein ACFB49_07340 [Sphingomonas sp. DBB INV C78]|uniref:hypothetical protein n=1 Tax=Sphingomonas sp. DBB INV C78 TaxID=3349434 RepID=UPI0036D3AF63